MMRKLRLKVVESSAALPSCNREPKLGYDWRGRSERAETGAVAAAFCAQLTLPRPFVLRDVQSKGSQVKLEVSIDEDYLYNLRSILDLLVGATDVIEAEGVIAIELKCPKVAAEERRTATQLREAHVKQAVTQLLLLTERSALPPVVLLTDASRYFFLYWANARRIRYAQLSPAEACQILDDYMAFIARERDALRDDAPWDRIHKSGWLAAQMSPLCLPSQSPRLAPVLEQAVEVESEIVERMHAVALDEKAKSDSEEEPDDEPPGSAPGSPPASPEAAAAGGK
jgi:hypothetical protein